LDAAASLLKPGGRLVYATCSVLPEENDAIVDGFVATHPEFAQKDAAAELARAGIAVDTGPRLRILPHRHGCDGFFSAVLERGRCRGGGCRFPRSLPSPARCRKAPRPARRSRRRRRRSKRCLRRAMRSTRESSR